MAHPWTPDELLRRLTPGRAFLLGAALWVFAHLVIHGPAGWPFPVPGEWDVLLPASALADGAVPRRWLAGLAVHEAASALLSLIVALPLALGLDPTGVARGLAMTLGAIGAGSLAVLAWYAALSPAAPDPGTRGFAAAIAALWVACTLPAWHGDVVGLDGSTPEATASMLAAFALLAGPAPGPLRPIASGLLLALATLLSPVCAPGVGVGVLLAGRRRVIALALSGGAVIGGALLFGGAGPAMGWATLAGSASTGTLLEDVGLLVPRALHAATAGLAPRGPGSLALGLLTMLSLLAAASLLRRPGKTEGTRVGRILGLAALGFLLLTLWTPASYRAWPTAYRYWQPALLLAAACVGVAFAGVHRRWRPLALVPVLIFVLGPGRRTPPRTATLAESLFATGIHKFGPAPWSDHALLRELAPHAPLRGGEGLLLGYGLLVGHKASAQAMEAPFASSTWGPLLASLPPRHAEGLAVGVGYGLTAPCDPTVEQLSRIADRPERLSVLYGIARGLAARQGALPSLRSLAAPDDEAAWEIVGEALRAGARTPAEVDAQPLDASALDAIHAGMARPGGGPWETAQMDELSRYQPPQRDCGPGD